MGGGFLLLLSLLPIACSDDDKAAAPPASVDITRITATRTSISFTLTPEHAVSYEYACVKRSEEAAAVFTRVDSPHEASFSVPSLDPATEYTVLARAANADGKTSATVRASVTTHALPSLVFGEFTVQSHKALVTVTTSGAEKFCWYCLPHDADPPADPAVTEVVCEGTQTPIEIAADLDGNPLAASTAYDLYAYAVDAEGPGETARAGFTTAEAHPVSLEITSVTATDIRFSVRMDQTLCDMYMVAASSPIIIDMIDWEEELMWNARWVEGRSFSFDDDELTTVHPGETYKIAVAPFRKEGYGWIPLEEEVVTMEVTAPAQ